MDRSKGVTIIEVLIASIISVVILAAALAIFSLSQRCFVTGLGFVDIHSDARKAIYRITRDIKWATRVMPASDTNTLVLEVPSIDGAGDIVDIDTTFDYITYQLDPAEPEELERIVLADAASSRVSATQMIANNVANIEFSSGGTQLSMMADVTSASDISIEITTTREIAGSWDLDETHTSSAHLRNRR
jgi:Tfp pilus assembly protein PilW